MAIDLREAFSGVNTTLNSLLSKYTKLRLIGFNHANENKPYYITDDITEGFYYKAQKLPKTGQVVDTLRIVPSDSDVSAFIEKATMLELADDEGNFVRYSFETLKEPEPPSFQWLLLIKPNKQDKAVITA